MPKFAVLLRGVNVGKAKRVPMAEFRTLLEAEGYASVRTLLNSGNAVFTSPDRSATKLADRIHAALTERFGFDVPVIVKSASDIAAIVADNELGSVAKDPSRLLVAFTRESQDLEALSTLSSLLSGREKLHVGKHAAYLWCANGLLESKAGEALLGKRGKSITTRNWATTLKIHGLLQTDSA